MKKILLASLLAAACASAFAQTSSFTGFSAALGANVGNSSTKMEGGGATMSLGDDSVWGSVSGEYGFAIAPKGVLGVGATIDLGDTKYGTLGGVGGGASFKGKDKYSVFVAPGFALSKDTLAFVKLGYHRLKTDAGAGVAGVPDSFKGFGFGLGVRHMINQNLFLQLEASQIKYSSKDIAGGTIKPTSTFGSLSLGYHF